MFPNPPEPISDPTHALVEVASYPTYQQAFEHSLVVLAMGRSCWLVPSAGTAHQLLVEPEHLEELHRQLACYDRESEHWPPKPLPVPPHRRQDFLTPVLWSLSVLATYWGEAMHPNWIRAGALDHEAMIAGNEWWRAATALFLHADTAHLVANCVSGIFVFAAITSVFGRGRGWISIALAAISGNVAAVVLNRGAYHSIGASTAVFAGVGLLTGQALRRLFALPRCQRWRAMLTPVAAGCTVLALYGAGGMHVDVLAHATGFVSGAIIGTLVRTA